MAEEELERRIASLDGPRALDPDFRERLERSLVDAAGTTSATAHGETRWRIDRPRELPAPFRARLENALVHRRARTRRALATKLIASIAALLTAATTMVVVDRFDRTGGGHRGPVIAAPSTPPAIRTAPPAAAKKPPGSLHAFASEREFLAYVREEALEVVGPYGIPGGGYPAYSAPPRRAPAQPGPAVPAPMMPSAQTDHSATNVQEAGVDEPDMVKTDGRVLVVASEPELWLLDATRSKPRVEGSLKLPGTIGVFLSGDRVIHLALRGSAPDWARRTTHVLNRSWTAVTVVDIADLSRPKVVSTFEVEGSYVGARFAGGVVRLVIRSSALGPEPVPVKDSSEKGLDAAEAANERAIRGSFAGDWVPHYVVERRGRSALTGHVHDWRAISRPPDKSGLGMLTVMTVDPSDPRPDNAVSVVGAGSIVYSSIDNLYVTSSPFDRFAPIAADSSIAEGKLVTRIHKFDIRDPALARYVGSGEVSGDLLNQFSLSEQGRYLRVASTTDVLASNGANSSASSVTVLTEKSGRLVSVGAVADLARGERIYSVRFIGSMAYVVTFRQVDPLFVIDLRRPTRPVVRGRLKVSGFSDYLHPVSDSRLVGVGRDANKAGVARGVQISLFDVSNPSDPRRLDVIVEGTDGYSPVGGDHHTFLYWEPRRLAVVPAELYENGGYSFRGAFAIRVGASGLGAPVRLTHAGRPNASEDSSIERSLVIRDRLLTISRSGVLVSDLVSFDDRAWVPFAA